MEAGEFAQNRLLPSEAELSRAHGASRVTIRRALDELRDLGLIDARQGFGWFVAGDPLVQSLGQLRTIEAQLSDAGISSQRRILDFAFIAAPPGPRAVLGAERVLEVRRLNLADGDPFARVTVWCPESLARHLSLGDVERAPFYELLDVSTRIRDADDRGLDRRRRGRRVARAADRGAGVAVPAHDVQR